MPKKGAWHVVDLKLAMTRGNTDITSGDFEIVAGREWQRWAATMYLEAVGAILDNEVIAESVLVDLMAVRDVNSRLGLVGEVDFYKNRFAGKGAEKVPGLHMYTFDESASRKCTNCKSGTV